MKVILIIAIIAGIGYYYFFKHHSCTTKADLQAKAIEVTEKFQGLVATGDLNKIMALTSQMDKLKALADSSDIQDACNAMDDLMAVM
ncbi:MAG TPA: hypothetical protein ENJ41_07410 [Oceanospirillales bacterium]|nr:hypothetical protein [Oceanospirillales bacterium]